MWYHCNFFCASFVFNFLDHVFQAVYPFTQLLCILSDNLFAQKLNNCQLTTFKIMDLVFFEVIFADLSFILAEDFKIPFIRPIFHFLKVVMWKQRDFLCHNMTYITAVPDNLSYQRMNNNIGVIMSENMRTSLKGPQLGWYKDEIKLVGVELGFGSMTLKAKELRVLVRFQPLWYGDR